MQTVAHKADDFISPVNTMWVLVAAFLVFFMQAGFMALEAGFSRSRETVNILMECIFDTCLCGVLYWAIGFAFQFGLGNGLIGYKYFFLLDHGATYDYGGLFDTKVAFLAFFLFQFAFADTASTKSVTLGAMIGASRATAGTQKTNVTSDGATGKMYLADCYLDGKGTQDIYTLNLGAVVYLRATGYSGAAGVGTVSTW